MSNPFRFRDALFASLILLPAIAAADTHVRWWKTGDVLHPTDAYAPSNAGTFGSSPIGVPTGANTIESGSGAEFSWGTWTGSFNRAGIGDTLTSNQPGDWIEGRLTPNGNLPSTGTKVFTGQIHGSVRDSDKSGNVLAFNRLRGSFTLTLNFGTGIVTGTLEDLVRITGNTTTEPWIDDVQVEAEILGQYGSGHFDSFAEATVDGLSKTGVSKEIIGGFVQGFLFGSDYAEMASEFELKDYSSPDKDTKAQGFLVSDPVRGPKLFGIMIGQDDRERVLLPRLYALRGDIDAYAVFNVLSAHPSWADLSEGNPSSPIVFSEVDEYDLADPSVAESIRVQLAGMDVRDGDTFVFYFSGHGAPYVHVHAVDPNPYLETPVVIDGVNNEWDEFLACGLNDDDLYRIFSDSKWAGVRKIFFLETCHGGGFLGTSDSDFGDLEKLETLGSPYALFASATEEKTSKGIINPLKPELNGRGIWTYELLLPALKNVDITVGGLKDYFTTHKEWVEEKYVGKECLLANFNGAGSTTFFDGLHLDFGASPDFDMSESLFPKVAAVDPNAAKKRVLAKKIRKLKKNIKKAKKKKRKGTERRLKRKLRKFQRQLRAL